MADIFSKKKRSQIMAAISSKETKPEIEVRSFLFSKGYRFRKNVNTMPGKPDIVLPKFQSVILIHGCFWHGHKNCNKSTLPKSNVEFWQEKIESNVSRDKRVKRSLNKIGWRVITIWECKLKNRMAFGKSMNTLLKRLNSQ